MSQFTDEYGKLLIKQYYDKPDAYAEVSVMTGSWGAIFDWMDSFSEAFDVDSATEDRLSIIGKRVGMSKDLLPESLTDEEYRFYVKLKILVNNTAGYMISGEYPGIQDAIDFAFGGEAEVFDNANMTLTLQVSDAVDLNQLFLIRELNLLPKPQGVRYGVIINAEPDSFGFAADVNARGFGLTTNQTIGGPFARIVMET